jgi:hypothetical protein
MDQGAGKFGTGSCWGHGTSAAIAILRDPSTGGPLVPFVPSPKGLYDNGRAVTLAIENPVGDLPPLEDVGTVPAHGLIGLNRFGVRAIEAPTSDGRYSDCEPATINEHESFLEIEDSQIVVTEHGINSRGFSRTVELCATLASKRAYGFGSLVGLRYQLWTPDQAPISDTLDASPDDGHWQCGIGYSKVVDGVPRMPALVELFKGFDLTGVNALLKVRNSWGRGVGAGGNWWVTDTWAQTWSDITVYDGRRVSEPGKAEA